ncbi:hypothetical protein ACH5RR_021271 [Cinchona calisaya]|uniref:Late blight resistance protein homolog R1A-3 n=1 Tax=Cinchona calisaya TaxID=153742 RepID=A0ABD2ZGU9_9GENT
MASTCINSIIDKLNLLENSNSIKEDNWAVVELVMLKLELRFLRTFLLCARKWSNHVSLSPSSSLEQAFQKNGQQLFLFLSLASENPSVSVNLAKRLSDVREMIKLYKEEIHVMYINLLDCLLRSSCSPLRDEFMEFMDSLLENLADFLAWNGDYDRVLQEQIESLQEKLTFLKIFIGFALFRRVEQRQLVRLLIHCDVVAVNAAHLSFIFWFYRKDSEVFEKMGSKISELLQKIKPVDSRDLDSYVQILKASKLSESSNYLTTEADKCIMGDFVDSLLGSLWELLHCGNSFVVSGIHQMRMLYWGLKFLGNMIKKQPEKFDGLHEKSKDLCGVVVGEAGIVIFSLHMHEHGLSKEMELSLFNLLEKIDLIKADFAEKYPVKSTFNFPTATELGFIDLLLENLKEMISAKVDLIFPAIDRFQTVQEDLIFLRSFLAKTVERHNQNEKLQSLRSRIREVGYNVEYLIDSLLVGDVSFYSLKLFSTILEEINLVKTEVLEIDENEYFLLAQQAVNTSSYMPIQNTSSTITEVVVGLDDEANTIIDQLTRGSVQLDIVSVVGMPGLGKTTLAKKVYHDPLIMCHFHIRAWCCISQAYCKKDLLLEILGCIASKHSIEYSSLSEDDLALELYKRLKGSRYVIVLDDVWDIEAWKVLERSFPNDAIGSRILLTSRLLEVALLVKPTGKPLPLRVLTDDESWELLQKKLAHKEGCPPAQRVLGMQIAKDCNGLPLTVVIIAGILSTLEQVGWEKVAEKLSSNIVCGTEQCTNILELSYKHLPDYLKPCLL